MRLNSLVLYLLIFASSRVFSQETVALRSVAFKPPTDDVYVMSVHDERTNRHLGMHKNLNGDKVTLYMDKGAEQSVADFYEISMPHRLSGRPVLIKIKELNVQESKRRMNSFIARVARAHVELVFLEKHAGEWSEVFTIRHNEDQVFGLYDKQNLYNTHEERIRAALEYCMLAFLHNYEEPKSLTESHFDISSGRQKINPKLGQWFNLVTAKVLRSTYFEGYGISYTGFVDSKKGLIRPYETSFEVTWARRDVAEENGFRDVNSFVFRPELYFFYKKITRGIYASVSANIPVGYEILENFDGDNSFNFVIGAGASQGLRIIPWEKRGLVIGADFFQQFETSRVYRFDVGVEVVVGINF
ncbi:MAG: hypothetical protein ACFB15_00455 [Cyclobacteriaceae bacterium]